MKEQPTPQQQTRIDVLMEAFEDFAIGIAIRTHGKIMRTKEPYGVSEHINESREALNAALVAFTRPMLRVVDNEPNGTPPE